jgi:hypothetical protein
MVLMRVFISHAKRDGPLADQLRGQLLQAGVDVWRDDQVYPGDNWAMKVGEALEQSDVLIALVTREAIESGRLVEDVQFALTSKRYRGRVIPVIVDRPTYEAGKDIPWILIKLDPIHVASARPDFEPVIDRVRSEAARYAAG